jgi:hypothetical protein
LKLKTILFVVVFMFMGLTSAFAAADKPNVEVSLISPDMVKEYPGAEKKIVARVTNHSAQPIEDMMVYITMADLTKHWTVNLEDYSADQPITIGTLEPGAMKEVSLPIRFVYTNHYHLYVTAASTKLPWIYSSSAIPIEIMGNTQLDPLVVKIVAIAEPLLLLGGLITILLRRRKLFIPLK